MHKKNFSSFGKKFFCNPFKITLLIAIVAAAICTTWLVVSAAPISVDATVNATDTAHNGANSTIVFTSDFNGYAFYADADGTCVYSKTTDSGNTWSSAVTVDPQTDCLRVAVWYDRWTPDNSGTMIHIATIDSGDSDVFYTSLDTQTDTLTATTNITGAGQTNVFAVGANLQSITRATDGDLYVGIQDNDDSYVVKCTGTCTNGANWSEAGASPFDLANDWLLLMPLPNGNILAIRDDISADDVQSKVYTDATNTWDGAWTNIDTNSPENATHDAHFGATVNLSTNAIYLAYAAQNDTLGTDDDIRTAYYESGVWTNKTDVVTDSARGITGAKIAYDEYSGDIYVLYSGQNVPGTAASANLYYKVSKDKMTTWGAENGPLDTVNRSFYGARLNIMSNEMLYATAVAGGTDRLYGYNVATLQIKRASTLRIFPQNILISLNSEDQTCVNTKTPELKITADGVSEMVLSNDPDFHFAEWETFQSPQLKTWELLPDDGDKTVYLAFRSAGLNLSDIYKLSFKLDSSGCGQTPEPIEETGTLAIEQLKVANATAVSKTEMPVIKKTAAAQNTTETIKAAPKTDSKKLNGQQKTTCKSSEKFTKLLYRSKKDSQVKNLQKTLICLGYLPKDLKLSENFDSATSAAVKKFQKDKKMYGSGIVGTKTRKLLNDLK